MKKILVHLTDTCYGFGVPFDDEKRIQRICKIKKRKDGKVFSLLFSDLDQVKKFCYVDEKQEKFILENKFFSSFILKKKTSGENNLKNFFPEFETVCVRIENEKFDFCPVKKDFFKNGGKPVTTTSVNISGDKKSYGKEKILEFFSSYDFLNFIFPEDINISENSLKSSKIFDLTKTSGEIFLRIR